MSTTLALNDLYSVRLNFRAEDKLDRVMNVLHYKCTSFTGAPTNLTSGLTEIAAFIYDTFKDEWKLAASEDVSFVNVTITNVFPLPRSVSLTVATDAGTVGSIVSEPLPLQDTPTLLKKTDVGNRWGLGRLFYVGTPESHQAAGVLTGPGVAALNNFMAVLQQDLVVDGTGFDLTLSPVLVRGPEDNPTSITPIRSVILSDSVLKTQRRRRPGKGD